MTRRTLTLPGLRRLLAGPGLLAFALQAHGLSGEPISGTVIDKATGEPVADAIVAVYWDGSWNIGHSSRVSCYHVETARTDARGRYDIAAWKTAWSARDVFFRDEGQRYSVYKPGYFRGYLHSRGAPPTVIEVAKVQWSKQAYFDTVFSPPWGCEQPSASGKNEYRLFKAMADEAGALAETPAQKHVVWMLRRLTEQSLVNFDRPTGYVGDQLRNVDPKDEFRKEDVPQ
jgi:hypothetical protein